MGKILPIIMAFGGLALGAGAGYLLKPAHDAAAEGQSEAAETETATDPVAPEYVRLSNQFVIPVVEQGRVAAMVVLSLSLEVEAGSTDAVFQREPRLRDAFLQVLFDHANTGGFNGSFTDGANLVVLRTSLREAAALLLGQTVKDVLITDIARQDS